jgi:superfamily I DNA and RNA helicase
MEGYFFRKKILKQKKTLLEEGLKMKDIITVARDMFMRGSSVEYIVKITGLSEEEITNSLYKNNY